MTDMNIIQQWQQWNDNDNIDEYNPHIPFRFLFHTELDKRTTHRICIMTQLNCWDQEDPWDLSRGGTAGCVALSVRGHSGYEEIIHMIMLQPLVPCVRRRRFFLQRPARLLFLFHISFSLFFPFLSSDCCDRTFSFILLLKVHVCFPLAMLSQWYHCH